MVIDFHYHFSHQAPSEATLAQRARSNEMYYAGQGRNGIPLTAEQIFTRLKDVLAPDPDGSRLLARMDAAGIDITVGIVVDRWGEMRDEEVVLEANRACAEWAKQHPQRLIAFAGVDPRRKKAPDLFRRCIEDYGMRGLKWHPDYGYYPNSPESYAVLKVCQELGVPLLTHTGPLPPPRVAKYVHPDLLDDVCLDFPNLKVVAAHCGRNWWHSWAGLAQFRKNLYGDLAMWQLFAVQNYGRFCHMLRDLLDWAGAESILLGTDSPAFEALVPNAQYIQILRDLPYKAPSDLIFTQAEVDAILFGNAKRVLGL